MTKNGTTKIKLSLEYLLRHPKSPSEKSPVIFFFHGYGSNEEDLFDLARDIPDEFFVISARAPIELGAGQYAWFPVDWTSGTPKGKVEDAEAVLPVMKQFVDECCDIFRIDSSRVFLLGFSQGAMTSAMLALSLPKLARGVVALSGRLFPKTQEETLRSPERESLHFFMGHGTGDGVIPVHYAHEQKECLTALGVPLEYHEYPMAHGISKEEYQDILAWLRRVS
jgi:phospholipase/carboxylesterase